MCSKYLKNTRTWHESDEAEVSRNVLYSLSFHCRAAFVLGQCCLTGRNRTARPISQRKSLQNRYNARISIDKSPAYFKPSQMPVRSTELEMSFEFIPPLLVFFTFWIIMLPKTNHSKCDAYVSTKRCQLLNSALISLQPRSQVGSGILLFGTIHGPR